MSERTIENPVINGPYEEPTLHQMRSYGRRVSSYFMPIPATKKDAL